MVMENSWLVTSPLTTQEAGEDEDQSDGISIISESDQDESQDVDVNSQYFWDNTHISLSNVDSRSEDQHVKPLTESGSLPETEDNTKVEPPDKRGARKLGVPWKIITLLLISNLAIYYLLELQHSSTVEKYLLADAVNKDLRLEINTLRKIIFLMNVDEQQQSPAPTTSPADPFVEPDAPEDVRILDSDKTKFICVDIRRLVDML